MTNLQDSYDEQRELNNELVTCKTCEGLGFVDVGDPENGVIRTCPACEGQGEILWANIPEESLSQYEKDLPGTDRKVA